MSDAYVRQTTTTVYGSGYVDRNAANNMLRYSSNRKPSFSERLSGGGRAARRTLICIHGISMIIAIAILALGGWAYTETKLTVFSNNIPLAVVILGASLFVSSFLGLWSACSGNRFIVVLSAVLSAAVCAIFVLASVVILVVSGKVDDNKYVHDIAKNYHRVAMNTPKDLCDIETSLKCSGFSNDTSDGFAAVANCWQYYPMTNATNWCPTYSLSDPTCFCPKNCSSDATNHFPNTCYAQLRSDIQENFTAIAASTFTFSGLLVVAWFFNWCMCCRRSRADPYAQVA